jgi:hypothetical protein
MRKTKNLALRKKRRRGKNKIEAQKELEKEKLAFELLPNKEGTALARFQSVYLK